MFPIAFKSLSVVISMSDRDRTVIRSDLSGFIIEIFSAKLSRRAENPIFLMGIDTLEVDLKLDGTPWLENSDHVTGVGISSPNLMVIFGNRFVQESSKIFQRPSSKDLVAV